MVIESIPFSERGNPAGGVTGMKGRGDRARSAELDRFWPSWKKCAKLPPLDDRAVESAVEMGLMPPWMIDGVETVRRFDGMAWRTGDTIPACAHGYIEKPIWNPYGLGIDAKRFETVLPITPGEGMMVQPFYHGDHVSTDVVIRDGVAEWGVDAYAGRTDRLGVFKRWTVAGFCQPRVSIHVPNDMRYFTGCINVERIGGRVIEVHFRPTLELFPIYGDEVIDALIDAAPMPEAEHEPRGDMMVVNDDAKVVDLVALGEVSHRRALVYFP